MIEKSQSAMEYYTIVALALIILIPLSIYVYQLLYQYGDDTKISLAKDAVKELGETADWVFSQGPSAKRTLKIYVPDDVHNISFENNMILFEVNTSVGVSDISYETVPSLNGSLPTTRGYYLVSLTAYANYVNITVVE